MRKNNVATGLFLILIAVVMMGSAMGFIPKISWFELFGGALVLIGGVKALFRRDFFGLFMSVGIVAWLFEEELKIEHLAPFPLLVAAALVGIGFNMIIGKKHRVVSFGGDDRDRSMEDIRKEEWQDGREILLENVFNSTSKYVNSAAFSSARLENNFGAVNVYFDNAVVYEGHATIDLENNFGSMNIYLPGKWRASISQESAFGHVNIYGEPNRDMDAPLVSIKAESNFGQLRIFFN